MELRPDSLFVTLDEQTDTPGSFIIVNLENQENCVLTARHSPGMRIRIDLHYFSCQASSIDPGVIKLHIDTGPDDISIISDLKVQWSDGVDSDVYELGASPTSSDIEVPVPATGTYDLVVTPDYGLPIVKFAERYINGVVVA